MPVGLAGSCSSPNMRHATSTPPDTTTATTPRLETFDPIEAAARVGGGGGAVSALPSVAPPPEPARSIA
jgi:hypothetical protein